jgi:hypothetical protein
MSKVLKVTGRASSSDEMWSATDHMNPENIRWASRRSRFAAEGTLKVVIGLSLEGILYTVDTDWINPFSCYH